MDRAKLAFAAAIALLGLGLAFALGLWSAASENWVYRKVARLAADAQLLLDQRETIQGRPTAFLQPATRPGSGVVVNEVADDDYVLVAGFFGEGPGVRLMERDGTIVAEWQADVRAEFPEREIMRVPYDVDWQWDLHGLVANPDGSIVFNWEYFGTVKLDRCGTPLWSIEQRTHHSVVRAETGGYWIADQTVFDRRDPNYFPPFSRFDKIDQYREDIILRVSEDGEILERHSVPRLFFQDPRLEALFTAAHSFVEDGFRSELTHLNKIAELTSDRAAAFPQFEEGDLALSLRRLNTLLVVDPDDWRVKWHQTGPYLRQHDVEFTADGRLSVFNNGVYPVYMKSTDGRSDLDAPRVSTIMEVDPATGEARVVYGGRAGQEMLSAFRGDHQRLASGHILVSEHEAGRLFEVDAEGDVIWEYINRYDKTDVLEMTDAAIYPKAYFTVTDWSCPAAR